MKAFLGAAAMAMTLSTCAFAQKAAQINFGHGFPVNSIHHEAAEQFRQEVEQRSNGALRINVFHSGQLGSAREMFEGLQLGTLQATWVPTARISGFAPQMQLFDLPFLFRDMESLEKIVDGDIGQTLLDTLSGQQITGIGFYIDGFKAMTANKPLRTLDDFRGVKFRTMESDIVMSIYRALGADPVPMDYAEVYNGLQMRIVDGQENPVVLIHDMKFYEVQKYLTLSEHAVLTGVLAYGTSWFSSLPQEQQDLLREAGMNMLKTQRRLAQAIEAENLETIRDSGTEIIVLTDEEKASLRQATQPVLDNFAKTYGSALIDRIIATGQQ